MCMYARSVGMVEMRAFLCSRLVCSQLVTDLVHSGLGKVCQRIIMIFMTTN